MVRPLDFRLMHHNPNEYRVPKHPGNVLLSQKYEELHTAKGELPHYFKHMANRIALLDEDVQSFYYAHDKSLRKFIADGIGPKTTGELEKIIETLPAPEIRKRQKSK